MNPALDDQQRFAILAKALFGDEKECALALAELFGKHRDTVRSWMGVPTMTGHGHNRGLSNEMQPEPEAVDTLMRLARRRIRELEWALEECWLPPWMTGL